MLAIQSVVKVARDVMGNRSGVAVKGAANGTGWRLLGHCRAVDTATSTLALTVRRRRRFFAGNFALVCPLLARRALSRRLHEGVEANLARGQIAIVALVWRSPIGRRRGAGIAMGSGCARAVTGSRCHGLDPADSAID